MSAVRHHHRRPAPPGPQAPPGFPICARDSGAGEGNGSARNVQRLRDHHLLPRSVVDVSQRSQAVTLFGRDYASAFGISAVGYAGNFRRDADLLLALSARAANVPFILSGAGTSSIESVARAAPDHVWYQLYAAKDPTLTDHM